MEGAALGAADLSEIPIEQIDHIEIVRGGLSALYGPNALGGVINVITKRAVYTGVPLSHVSYEDAKNGRQTYRLDFGSRQGPVDYFFFGNQEWESGFRDNSDHRLYNIGGNAGIPLGKKGKLLFDVASYHNNAGVPGFRCDNTLDPTCPNDTTPLEPNRFDNKDEKYALTPNARQISDSNYLRTSYFVSLSTKVYMAARFFGNTRETDYDDSFDVNPALVASTDRREHTTGGDLQFNLPLGLVAGGSFSHDQENYLDRLNFSDSFSASEDQWGFFAEETWRWRSLTLIPSGRYDENSQFGHTANPRLQGLFDANDWLRFSSSAGRSFRTPTFDEMAPMSTINYLGNPNLLPETAWNYDAGFELHESSKSFKANYFRANIENTIQTMVPQDPSNPASPLTAVNLDRSFRQGAEITMSRVVSSTFRDSWNYTYLENMGTPAGLDHLVPLAYSPRHSANYTATFVPAKKWEIDPTLRFESARYSGNDQGGTEMGAQVILDLRLAYQWRQAELFFGIKDVTDKRYEEQPGYPLPGRTTYAGIKLRLWG
jgi:outer membrane receptor protein involved in Fe transport